MNKCMVWIALILMLSAGALFADTRVGGYDNILSEVVREDESDEDPFKDIVRSEVIDKEGKVIFSTDMILFGQYSDGLIRTAKLVKVGKTGNDYLFGYMDKSGNIAIKPQYSYAWEFSEGLALVQQDKGENYIDKSGKTAITLQKIIRAEPFSEGLAAVYTSANKKDGFIDKSGKIVIDPVWEEAGSFKEGLAPVSKYGNKEYLWGFIDKAGKVVIKPKYYSAEPFSEGLSLIKDKYGRYGYIDKTGEYVIKPKYDFADSFHEGLAYVIISRSSGFIDKTGNMVIELSDRYKFKSGFSEGLALLTKSVESKVYPYPIEDEWCFIDKQGKTVWTQKADPSLEIVEVFPLSEGIAVINYKKKTSPKSTP